MTRRSPPAKSPISNRCRRAWRATPSSSRRSRSAAVFRCTMRVDCGQLDAGAAIRPEPGEWQPRMPERLDEEELADWRTGRGLSARRPDDRRSPCGRRCISRGSFPCLLCRRFVHIKHNVINC
jgi:hypothetical protein